MQEEKKQTHKSIFEYFLLPSYRQTVVRGSLSQDLGESEVVDPIWDDSMGSLAVIASVVKAAFNLKCMTLLYQN